MIEDIDSVREAVEEVLKKDKIARENDTRLIFRVLEVLGYAEFDLAKEKFVLKAGKETIQEMPKFESIRRTRQKLQQQGKYLPKEEIQELRKQEQEKMRHKMARSEA